MASKIDLNTHPGYHIRRLQQIAVAIFLDESQELGITPIQYAALQAIHNAPGIDQKTLASSIGVDTSTIGGVIERLNTRGLVARTASVSDRRVKRLNLTAEGKKLLAAVIPAMLRAQQRILAPLSERDSTSFMRMLKKLVDTNNDLSRAPSDSV
jgi:MarR family transcriptional regulator, lower aerobic nicotinate degradation pathway regulator